MSTPEEWTPVELLAEPTRRQVFDAVRGADRPVTREEVADEVHISQRLAAFHLERLLAGGLLVADYARPAGIGGPGAGRPAKRYRPADVQVSVVVPPRQSALAGRLLAEAVAAAPPSVQTRVLELAERTGTELGRAHRAALGARRDDEMTLVAGCLGAMGYEPRVRPDSVELRNCPFHDVVDTARGLVCSMNRELLTGLLTGLRTRRCAVQAVDAPPGCCAAVTAGGPAARRKGRTPTRP